MSDIMQELQTKLSRLMQTLQLENAPSGGSLVVFHEGKLIAECNIGQATKNSQWAADTLSLNYSTGKGVLVTLIHVLVSLGKLDFDTVITEYWPSFVSGDLDPEAHHLKSKITLRDILTHRANLFNIQSITEQADDMLDWDEMLKKIEKMSPELPRNQSVESCYSALVSGWVLGGLIEKVTEMPLNKALNDYLAKPLGVEGEMIFGVEESQVDNVATLIKYFDDKPGQKQHLDNASHAIKSNKSSKPTLKQDSEAVTNAYKTLPSYACWYELVKQENNLKDDFKLTTADITKLYFEMGSVNLIDYKNALWPSGKEPLNYYEDKALIAKIPAANNVSSARALGKMYAMIANQGKWEGQQLISPNVFNELTKVYVTGSDAIMAATAPSSMHWRLGYHRLFTRCNLAPNAFGHMGYNGSTAWCDVDRKLAVSFVHNYRTIMSTDIRQFAINEAILQWVDEYM